MALLALVFLIWFFYGAIVLIFFSSMETRGLSGDMFGGITALFSGLAFAGLIYTLFVQKKELQYQRVELEHLVEEQKNSGNHLAAQATHLANQSEFIEKQIFENRFFQMLSSYSDYVSGIQFRESTGADALEKLCSSIRPRSFSLLGEPLTAGSIDAIREFEESFDQHKNDLAPYFRILYNILKFVKKSNISDKRYYTNFLRARVSSAELTLLCLNCASKHGVSKMAPLVREFEFLKHFDDFKLFEEDAYSDSLRNFYHGWNFYEQHKLRRDS